MILSEPTSGPGMAYSLEDTGVSFIPRVRNSRSCMTFCGHSSPLRAFLSCPSGPGGSHPTSQGSSSLRKGWG